MGKENRGRGGYIMEGVGGREGRGFEGSWVKGEMT